MRIQIQCVAELSSQDAPNGLLGEIIPADLVGSEHLERSRGGPLLLIAQDCKARLAYARSSVEKEALHRRRIAVESKYTAYNISLF